MAKSKSLKRALEKIAKQSDIHTCPICGQKGHEPEHNSSYGEVIVIDGVTFCRYADFTYPCGCKATIDRQTREAKQKDGTRWADE